MQRRRVSRKTANLKTADRLGPLKKEIWVGMWTCAADVHNNESDMEVTGTRRSILRACCYCCCCCAHTMPQRNTVTYFSLSSPHFDTRNLPLLIFSHFDFRHSTSVCPFLDLDKQSQLTHLYYIYIY